MTLPVRFDATHVVDRYPPCGVGLLRAWRIEMNIGRVTVLEYADRIAIYGAVDFTWSQLDRVRRLIWNDRRCVEVYPKWAETIDLAPTRHLWASDAVDVLVADLSARLHATLAKAPAPAIAEDDAC